MASCSSLLTNHKLQIWFIKHRRPPIAITATKGKGIRDYISSAYAYVRGKKWEQKQTSPDFLPLAGSGSHDIEMVICMWQSCVSNLSE